MKKFDLLHYDQCIANLPNSILKKFGVPPVGNTLAAADRYLEKEYRNIVVLLLDGMGTRILERNLLQDGFFRSHLAKSYHTVFPPTTVAATTSMNSGLMPIGHAWLGWDCYYPQVDRNVTVFRNTLQGTDLPVAVKSVAKTYCGYESVVDRLCSYGKQAYYATPFEAPCPDSFDAVCRRITRLCGEEGSKYIYAYWTEPDTTMHRFGCCCGETKEMLTALEEQVRDLCGGLRDTLLIITADHGHVDGRNVVITDYPDIMECLVRMPSIEPRALNLFVKKNKKKQFEEAFDRAFGSDFLLLTREEVLEGGLFGTGGRHPNVEGMIGDYVAVATTDLTVCNTAEEAERFKGVHAGYTEDEMEIPLIVIEPMEERT